MNHKFNLQRRFREVIKKELPLPNIGSYSERLSQLFEVGREDLSLAKLAEAHWDAVAILAEEGREAEPDTLYAVWASEIPGKKLNVHKNETDWSLSGTKMFCSGAGIVDRALVTADDWLIDVDLRNRPQNTMQITNELWVTQAFKETNTSTLFFNDLSFNQSDMIGTQGWYVQRNGFWHGALGPAACWGGGAAGLVDYALNNSRKDAHTLAHLAAMDANLWAIKSVLHSAGEEIDTKNQNSTQAQALALKIRHLIEQLCTDIHRRFARAYGPFPIACDDTISRRYQELDLYLRQSHAERDLESLGILLKS